MKNKEIQEARIKGYFIEATKSILKGEGLKALSVRSVSDQAGYSYATLYNYFKDINDLVFLCVKDFQDEIESFVAENSKATAPGLPKLKAAIKAWVGYFTEYPGIFELFYIVKGGDFGNKESIIQIIETSLERACKNDWNYCIDNNLVDSTQAEIKKSQLKYTLLGILILYLNRKKPISYVDFTAESKAQIEQILN